MPRQTDTPLLQAALVGYQAELARIKAAIADLQKRLGKVAQSNVPVNMLAQRTRKRHLSAEGRARIAEAQRRRWAAAKKAK
jgi:hypothetical protein